MKKRLLAIMLSIALILTAFAAPLSAFAAEEGGGDDGDGIDVLGLAETVGQFYNGISATVDELENSDHEVGFGEAFVCTLKNLGKSIAGIEDGDEGTSSPDYSEQIDSINLSVNSVASEIKSLTTAMETQGKMLDSMDAKLDANFTSLKSQLTSLANQLENATTRNDLSDYLNKFFDFYDDYEAKLTIFERLVANCENEIQLKSANDEFFCFNGGSTNGFYLALEKMNNYLQGEIKTTNSFTKSGSYSLISVICDYLELAGCSNSKIAEIMDSFVTEIYYAYMLGTYYYCYIASYQLAYLKDNNVTEYYYDTAKCHGKTNIISCCTEVMDDALKTTSVIISDMQKRFVDYSEISIGYLAPDINYFVERAIVDNKLNAEPGSTIYLPDPAELLGSTFSSDIVKMADIDYQYKVTGNATVQDNRVTVNSTACDDDVIKIELIAGVPVNGYTEGVINTTVVTVKNSELPNGAGYGDSDYPFLICTTEDYRTFVEIRNAMSNSEASYVYQLRDLDFEGETVTPINFFLGDYNGCGYSIKNANIMLDAANNSEAGLIKVLNGNIHDVNFSKISVVMFEFSNQSEIDMGVIAGYGYQGSIERCTVDNCTVYTNNMYNNAVSYGNICIGGICGFMAKLNISDCIVSDTEIYADDHSNRYIYTHLGGIVGRSFGPQYNYSTCNSIYNCGVVNCDIYADNISDKFDCIGTLAGEIKWTYIHDNFIYMLWGESYLFTSMGNVWGAAVGHIYSNEYVTAENNYIYTGDNAYYAMNGVACGGMRTSLDAIYDYNNHFGNNAFPRVTSLKLSGLSDSLKNSCLTDGSDYPVLASYTQTVDTGSVRITREYGEYFTPATMRVRVKMNGQEVCTSKVFYAGLVKKLAKYTVMVSLAEMGSGNQKIRVMLYKNAGLEDVNIVVDNSKHAHNYEKTERVEKCTTDGYQKYECECGAEYSLVILPLGHDYVNGVCTRCFQAEAGLGMVTSVYIDKFMVSITEGQTEKLSAEILPAFALDKTVTWTSSNEAVATVAADGTVTAVSAGEAVITVKTKDGNKTASCTVTVLCNHSWDKGTVTLKATCIATGIRTYKCTKNGCTGTKTEVIAKNKNNHTGGTEVKNITAASCGVDGNTGDVCCKGCGGIIFAGQPIYATGDHEWDEGEETTEPGCTTAGVRTYTCTICAKERTEEIPALGHDYQTEVIPAGCEEDGYTSHICSRCGDEYHDNITSKTGHNYGEYVTKMQPSCTDIGMKFRVCANCENYDFADIEALGHSWDSGKITKAATCKATGVKTYTCTVCEATKTEAIAKTTTHTWDSGKITTKATCAKAGVKTYTCTVCEATKTEAIAKTTSHTWDSGKITTKATCAKAGVKTYTCTVCEATKTEAIAKTTSHVWDSGKITTKATCAKAGVRTYTCTVCGAAKTETVAKKSHSYTDVVTAATLTADGKIQNKCSVCGTVKSTTAISKIKSVTLAKTAYTYTGKALKPTVTVKDSAGNTVATANYTVAYKNNTNAGKATVTVTFKGNYSGTKTLTFKINPKETTVSKVASAKAGVATVTVTKQATQTTGYEIQYSTSSKFTTSTTKTVKITSATTLSKAISGLTSGKTYYFRVRTYKTVSKVDYTSAWSTSVKAKIK